MAYFAGKIAVVTGGGSGIGRALCFALARHDAVVTVADINEDGAQRVAGAIQDAGGRAFSRPVDVRDMESVTALVDQTVSRHGRLDLMFNNAGLALDGELHETSGEDWKRVVDVNLHGVLNGSAAAYRAMLAQGHGQILNVASLAGLVPVPGMSVYAATKHAVVGFSTSLRGEARLHGIRVNVVCSGFVEPMSSDEAGSRESAKEAEGGSTWPVRRMDSDTCARAILRGVAKDKAITVMPGYASVAAGFYRLFPGIYNQVVVRIFAGRMKERTGAA